MRHCSRANGCSTPTGKQRGPRTMLIRSNAELVSGPPLLLVGTLSHSRTRAFSLKHTPALPHSRTRTRTRTPEHGPAHPHMHTLSHNRTHTNATLIASIQSYLRVCRPRRLDILESARARQPRGPSTSGRCGGVHTLRRNQCLSVLTKLNILLKVRACVPAYVRPCVCACVCRANRIAVLQATLLLLSTSAPLPCC